MANFQIERWCEEAGGNIKINYQSKDPKAPVTPTDETNPFWIAFKNATDELFVSLKINLLSVRRECFSKLKMFSSSDYYFYNFLET